LERFFSEHHSLKDLAQKIKDGSWERLKDLTLDTIFEEVRERDGSAYDKIRKQHEQFRVSLVVNMAENRKDYQIAESMQRVLKEKTSGFSEPYHLTSSRAGRHEVLHPSSLNIRDVNPVRLSIKCWRPFFWIEISV